MNAQLTNIHNQLDRPYPLYQQVAKALRAKILNGELSKKEKLPTEAELSRTLVINNRTLRRALDLLQKEGLLIRIRGKGTFIADKRPDSHLVAIFINQHAHVEEPLYHSLLAQLQEAGYIPVLFDTVPDHRNGRDIFENSRAQLDEAIKLSPHAFVIDRTTKEFDYEHLWQRRDDIRHLLFIHHENRDYHFQADYVVMNKHQAAYMPAKHLVDLGHRNICIVRPQSHAKKKETTEATDIAEESRGYRDALTYGGENILYRFLYGGCQNLEVTEERIRKVLTAPDRPTAILAYQDSIAVLVVKVAKQFGLRIPADLAVVGRFNTPWTHVTEPPLTSVSICEDKIAGEVVKKIARGPHVHDVTEIQPQLIVRFSCGGTPTDTEEDAYITHSALTQCP